MGGGFREKNEMQTKTEQEKSSNVGVRQKCAYVLRALFVVSLDVFYKYIL